MYGILALAGLLVAAGLTVAGSESDPEISDARGDVNVELLIPELATDGEAPALPAEPPAAAAAADLLGVWVPTDSEDSFTIAAAFDDVPDEPDAAGAATETWIYFTIDGIDYRANITLFAPEPAPDAAPGEQLRWRHATYLLQGNSRMRLAGAVDPVADLAHLFVPRDLVGSPEPGDRLTKFWAVTRAGKAGPALDYAPGATALNPTAFDPANPTLGTTPEYGADYVFGPEATPTAALMVVIPDEREVREGSSRPASITVSNDAEATDTVQLAVDAAPPGWTATISPSTLTLEPGQSRSVEVTLSPSANAADYGQVKLRITSSLGADEMPAFDVALQPAPLSSGPADRQEPAQIVGGDGQAPADDAPAETPSDEGNGVPFPGVGFIALAGAAAALAVRRD